MQGAGDKGRRAAGRPGVGQVLAVLMPALLYCYDNHHLYHFFGIDSNDSNNYEKFCCYCEYDDDNYGSSSSYQYWLLYFGEGSSV